MLVYYTYGIFLLLNSPFISSIRFNIFAAFATSCGDAVVPYGLNGFIPDNEFELPDDDEDWGADGALVSDGVLLLDLPCNGD